MNSERLICRVVLGVAQCLFWSRHERYDLPAGHIVIGENSSTRMTAIYQPSLA